jgi:ATP phosphoribosyltransferase regulatory subunit
MEGDKVRHTILQTPRGLADLVGREVALMHLIEEKLSKLLASWGYQEVHTPTIEFADVLAKGSEGELKDAFCFIDRQGDLVALRPEMTTPCARLLASRLLSQPMPIRLFYAGRVFRYEEPQEGRNREFRQIGVELAGLPAPVGDAEVVALAVHAFETLGLEDFQFTVSHIGILEGLLEAAGIDKEDRHRLAHLLRRGDFVAYRRAVGELAKGSLGEILAEIPRLRGEASLVKELEERLAKEQASLGLSNARRALFELSTIFELLEIYGVLSYVKVDLGMVKDFTYYTGLIMEGYTADLGYTIASGGRYDQLLKSFGRSAPASGWALGVERLLLALERQGKLPKIEEKCEVLITPQAGTKEHWPQALALAKELRKLGYPTEVNPVLDPGRAMQMAKEREVNVLIDYSSEPKAVFFPSEKTTSIEDAVQLLKGGVNCG